MATTNKSTTNQPANVKKAVAKKVATKKVATPAAPKEKKAKKSDIAFSIYAKHASKRETMSKKEFRTMVVAEMSETLGVTNKGTLGMYFAWSEQVITGRGAKVYSRGDGSRARKGSKQDDGTEKALNELAKAFNAASAKAVVAEDSTDEGEEAGDPAPFKPRGFGVSSF